ncbi:hypothetical protein GX50_09020, partial [[Emmonsia] crescens]
PQGVAACLPSHHHPISAQPPETHPADPPCPVTFLPFHSTTCHQAASLSPHQAVSLLTSNSLHRAQRASLRHPSRAKGTIQARVRGRLVCHYHPLAFRCLVRLRLGSLRGWSRHLGRRQRQDRRRGLVMRGN